MLENPPVAAASSGAPASPGPTSVSPALLIGVVLAQFGAFIAVFAPSFIALSISVGTLTPEDRVVNLGIVLAPARSSPWSRNRCSGGSPIAPPGRSASVAAGSSSARSAGWSV